MELKEKVDYAMRADFIGDVSFTEDELAQLKEECIKGYKMKMQSFSKKMPLEKVSSLIVLIVNLVKNWGEESEKRFWVKAFGEIFDDSSIRQSSLYDDFCMCLQHYNKTLFISKKEKRMFRDVFLMHAFASQNASKNFIKLLWSWYSDNSILNYDYQQNDPTFEKMARYLHDKFLNISDVDENVDFEGKTYAITSAFKYLYACDQELGIILLDRIFSNFDSIYFENKFDRSSFISKRCYEEFELMLKENSIRKERRKRSITDHIINDYQKIYAEYRIDEQAVPYLYIPEIRAIDEYSDEYKVYVYDDNGKVLYEDEGYIVGDNLKRRINKITIPLNEVICKSSDSIKIRISLVVLRDGEEVEVFNSKESLYRDYILLGNSREIKSNLCAPNQCYYVVSAKNIELNNKSNCQFNYIEKYTYSIVPKENDYIKTNKKQVFFNDNKTDINCILIGQKINNAVYIMTDNEYDIYNYVSSIDVRLPDSVNKKALIIYVDDKRQYNFLENSIQNDEVYSINLANIGAEYNGTHKIVILDTSRDKMLYSKSYYVKYTLKMYIDNNGYIFDNKTTNFKIVDYDNVDNRIIYENVVKAGVEEIEIDYDDGKIRYKLPYIKWSIDYDIWFYNGSDEIKWGKDKKLHNNCVIAVENNSKNNVLIMVNDDSVDVSKKNIYLLGDKLINEKKEGVKTVYLKVNEERYKLFDITFNEMIEKKNVLDINDIIYLEEKKIDLSEYFIGDEDSEFIIRLENEDSNYEIRCGVKSDIPQCIKEGEYDVTISLLDFFDMEKCLLKDTYIIGNPEKFYFDGYNVILRKFYGDGKDKIIPEKAYIVNIHCYKDSELDIIYRGLLKNKGNRFPVEFYKKDGNDSLRIYYVDKNDELSTVYYDKKAKVFIKMQEENNDNQEKSSLLKNENIVQCNSIYYKMDKDKVK